MPEKNFIERAFEALSDGDKIIASTALGSPMSGT